jgi:SAM-dependent methyltransferase
MTASNEPPDGLQYDGHDLEALFELKNYQRWIADCFKPYLSGEVVEFGAGIGAMSQWFAGMADRIDLVEPSPNLVKKLNERFRENHAVRVFGQSLQEYSDHRGPETLDGAVMVNLLEHIEDDLAALSGIKSLLRPGGRLMVFVPAMPALYSRLDQLLGHHRRYTKGALADVVQRAGFEIENLRYFDLLGILPWWLVNTLGAKEKFDGGLSRLYDCVGVPVTRAVETLIAPPIGKNLLLIARKLPGQTGI